MAGRKCEARLCYEHPAIHVLAATTKNHNEEYVYARDRRGHDDAITRTTT
jgi:hypothetical protein